MSTSTKILGFFLKISENVVFFLNARNGILMIKFFFFFFLTKLRSEDERMTYCDQPSEILIRIIYFGNKPNFATKHSFLNSSLINFVHERKNKLST